MNLLIYKKDSTLNMAELNTASIDLILTSPPYWNIVDYNHPNQLGTGLTYKHFLELLKKNLFECMRVLKEDGFAIFVVGDIRKEGGYSGKNARPRIFSIHSDIIQYFTNMDFDFFQHFIWRKYGVKKGSKEGLIYGSVGTGEFKDFAAPPFLYTDLLIEHILVFRKPGKKRILPSLKSRLMEKETRLLKKDLEVWLNPVWDIDSPRHSKHPATFPGDLVERLIRLYSLKNDTILDPFVGTGTTLKKALSLDRLAIGYDINERYIQELIDEYDLRQQEVKYCYSNFNELEAFRHILAAESP